MFKDAAVAKQISDVMIDVSDRLDRSIVTVKEQCSKEEFQAYRFAVGKILGEVLLEVLNALYAAHPSLKPPRMD
jgi:hypothetical protein